MSEKKSMHWFELHWQKILGATKGWKDDEFGAYVKLLIEQFDNGFVPDDPEAIDRLITSRKKNWPLLAKKFVAPSEPGQLRNAFMITIRDGAHAKSQKNAESGKMGVEAKKRKIGERFTERQANALPNADDSLKPPLSQPITNNQEPITNTNTAADAPGPVGIDRVKEVAREVWESKAWCEAICMGHSITPEGLKKWMAQFNASICNDIIHGFDQSRYQKLFGGWLNAQKGKGYNLNSALPKEASAPPLKTI